MCLAVIALDVHPRVRGRRRGEPRRIPCAPAATRALVERRDGFAAARRARPAAGRHVARRQSARALGVRDQRARTRSPRSARAVARRARARRAARCARRRRTPSSRSSRKPPRTTASTSSAASARLPRSAPIARPRARRLPRGIHGVSNAQTRYAVAEARAREGGRRRVGCERATTTSTRCSTCSPTARPRTTTRCPTPGFARERERLLSSPFIVSARLRHALLDGAGARARRRGALRRAQLRRRRRGHRRRRIPVSSCVEPGADAARQRERASITRCAIPASSNVVAGRDEAVPRVERHRRDLRVDDRTRVAARARAARSSASISARADAAAAPSRDDRHAADVPVGSKRAQPIGDAAASSRERVDRLAHRPRPIRALPARAARRRTRRNERGAAPSRRRTSRRSGRRTCIRMHGARPLASSRHTDNRVRRSIARPSRASSSHRPPTGNVSLSGTWPNGRPV